MTTEANYFNDAESERSLLGLILQHNEVLDQHKVIRDMFYEESHRQIFDEILRVRARGSTADMPSIALALRPYAVQIATLTDYLVGDVSGLVQRLRDCIQARGVAAVIRNITEMQSKLKPSQDVVEEATRGIIQISENRNVSYKSLTEVAIDTIHEITARKNCKEKYSGVPAGIEPLDHILDGFQDGDYIILGARPSVGKTALALTFTLNAAFAKESVGFISLEMKDTAIFKRVLAARSGVSMQAIRTGALTPRDMSDLIDGCGSLADKKIFFADTPNMHIDDLTAEARILKTREKITFLVIDYIGLITAGFGQIPRWDIFSKISQRLKALARELNIPVLVLSQLTRQSDAKRPSLADLRETGCLAADSLVHHLAGNSKIFALASDRGIMVHSNSEEGGSTMQAANGSFYSGNKQTYEITLITGHTIRATANHKFLVPGREWLPVERMQKGTMLGLYLGNGGISESSMSDDELKMVALFIGNGCAIPRRSLQYTSNAKDEDLCLEIMAIANRLFPRELRPVFKLQKYREGTQQESSAINVFFSASRKVSRAYHNPLVGFFKEYGLYDVRAKDKAIPDKVFSQRIESKRLFLKYLWATDGTIAYSDKIKKVVCLAYSSSSIILILQIQSLLQDVGILSSISTVHKGRFVSYILSIQSRYFKIKFMQEVGIAGNRKSDILRFCLDKTIHSVSGWTKYELSEDKSIVYVPIKSIIPYGEEAVYDIEVPVTHNFVANGFIVHNSLEQDADVVMLMHREEQSNDQRQPVKLIVAKQRNGEVGDIDLQFDKARMRFFAANAEHL